MSSTTKKILIVTIVVVLLIAMLVLFYLYLLGGSADSNADRSPDRGTGLIPVMSIYKYGTTAIEKPVGVASDSQGNIYVTMRDGSPVLVYDSNGKFLRKWGTRGANSGQMMSPTGIAVDDSAGHVYVTDRARLRLICYNLQGDFQWEVPVLGAVSPAVAPNGDVFVSTHGPIVQFDDQGQLIRQFGTRGQASGQFDFPHQMVVSQDGKTLYVADSDNARLQAIKPSGTASSDEESVTIVASSSPVTATVVWSLGDPPKYQDDPDTRFGVPSGITADSKGRLYVLDGFRFSIEVVDPKKGTSIYKWSDLQGQANGLFNLPTNIAYMGGDRFAITDTYNDRVQIIRLLPPGSNNVVSRNPWLWWLLIPLLLLLLSMLRRRRVHVTRDALNQVLEDGDFRLLAAAYKKLWVLQGVYDSLDGVEEEGVQVTEYLRPIDPEALKDEKPDAKAAKAEKDIQSAAPTENEQPSTEPAEEPSELELLVRAAKQTVLQKVLFVKNPVVCEDEGEAREATELGAKALTLDEVHELYEYAGKERKPAED